MYTLRWIILVAIFFEAVPICPAQRGDREIKQKQKELQKLRDDIQRYEKKLNESEQREKATLDRLDDLERQSNLIRQLIQKLHEEEQLLTTEIDTARVSIEKLEGQLQFLQSHYANYVRSVYKNGRVYDIELLASSKSINQLYIRIQYLKRFSEQRAKDVQNINSNKKELEQKNNILQDRLQKEHQLLTEKTQEEGNLRNTYARRRVVLSKIRKDKKTYQKELVRKNQAYQQIEKIIDNLIEKERIRKEREEAERQARELAAAQERERKKSTVAPELPKPPETSQFGNFEHKRGTLRWPITNGTVQSHFGNHIHPVLKTVTQNTGIDIATPVGSNVYAVANGEVSVISFIPGFGNVLIINHYNGYRTVYAHLAEVLVSESQKVSEGTVIARSGDTIDQPLIHFEIWKEREKQDPERWLMTKR